MKKNRLNNKKIRKSPKSLEDFGLRKLGAVIRRERERRGLTQLQIAKRMGKSEVAIHYYEAGKRPLHFGTFTKICSAIRVSPGFIIDEWMKSEVFDVLDEERRKEYHSLLDEMIKYGFSRELDNLVQYFRGLVEKEKDAIRREKIRREYHELHRIHKYGPGEQGDDGV